MQFTRTKIHEVVLIEPTMHGDHRGYFSETFRKDLLEEFLGFSIPFCQDNESKSNYGVLRGLHYQLGEAAQTKLVRVLQGRILDVVVDVRKGSPTFGQHIAMELSGDNRKQLLIPKGFAHGFSVLSEHAVVVYKVDNYYSPNHYTGFAYDDASLGIDWKLPKEDIQLSEMDQKLGSFAEAPYFEMKEVLFK